MTINELHDFIGDSARMIQDNVLGPRISTSKPWKAVPSHVERQAPRPGAIAHKPSVTEWDNWKPIRDVV